MPRPLRLGAHETLGMFADPGMLVSLAVFGAFFIAFALLMPAVTGKL